MTSDLLALIIPFFIASVAIELTPGPNMAYLAIVGASRGRAPGLVAVCGVALGLALLGTLAALGLTTLVTTSRVAWELLRWAGMLYLLWLAYDTWHDANAPVDTSGVDQSLWRFFRQGLITNLLNPKAALFYITVLPGFTVDGIPLGMQVVWLTAVYVLVATGIHAGIVLASGTLAPLFTSGRFRSRAGLGFALLLVAVAIWLFIKTAQ